MLIPWLHPVVARWQFGAFGHDAGVQLSGKAIGTGCVPPLGKDAVVLVDELSWCLVRGMARSRSEQHEPRCVGRSHLMAREELDRSIGEILGEVIAGCPGARCGDVAVVANQFRRVLVGLGVEEAVIAIEATAKRPPVERAARSGFGQAHDVPLAHHVVAVAVRAKHLRDGRDGRVELASITGKARIEIGEAAHADAVMVVAGEEAGPRGRAHGGCVETGHAHAFRGEAIDDRGVDLASIAPEVTEADVIEEDDEDVR